MRFFSFLGAGGRSSGRQCKTASAARGAPALRRSRSAGWWRRRRCWRCSSWPSCMFAMRTAERTASARWSRCVRWAPARSSLRPSTSSRRCPAASSRCASTPGASLTCCGCAFRRRLRPCHPWQSGQRLCLMGRAWTTLASVSSQLSARTDNAVHGIIGAAGARSRWHAAGGTLCAHVQLRVQPFLMQASHCMQTASGYPTIPCMLQASWGA